MTKQEKRQLYIDQIPTLEGSKYMAGDAGGGLGTRFGVSVAFTKTFTSPEDRTITESILRTAPFTQFVPFISRFLARIGYDDISSVEFALSYADHAYNTGWSGAMGDLQRFLVVRYRANLTVDGKVGALTLAAINSALRQYGEARVVWDWYRWRKAYYEGRTFPRPAKAKVHRNGCSKPVCRTIITSRLNKYFYPKNVGKSTNGINGTDEDDIFSPISEPLKIEGGGVTVTVSKAKTGDVKSILLIVVVSLTILFLLYLAYSSLSKK